MSLLGHDTTLALLPILSSRVSISIETVVHMCGSYI